MVVGGDFDLLLVKKKLKDTLILYLAIGQLATATSHYVAMRYIQLISFFLRLEYTTCNVKNLYKSICE